MSDQTTWEPSGDGGITIKTRNKDYWRTVFKWKNDMPKGISEYDTARICEWLDQAYKIGRQEAMEDVRNLIGAKGTPT